VRDNGSKAGQPNTYTLVYGCRRCLAILYNWCLTGIPREPVVDARLEKGGNTSLLQKAMVENTQRAPTLLEEAEAIRHLINVGLTKEQVAQGQGVSLSTLENRLRITELEPDTLKKIREGKLSVSKALAQRKEQAPNHRPKKPGKKELEKALAEFAEDTVQHRMLAWVLGLRKDF
jgi:hypothetical protein